MSTEQEKAKMAAYVSPISTLHSQVDQIKTRCKEASAEFEKIKKAKPALKAPVDALLKAMKLIGERSSDAKKESERVVKEANIEYAKFKERALKGDKCLNKYVAAVSALKGLNETYIKRPDVVAKVDTPIIMLAVANYCTWVEDAFVKATAALGKIA